MIREMKKEDKEIFLTLMDEFYHSEGVLHSIPLENIENTFIEAINNSPFITIFIIEKEDSVAGYALISKTFSGEVGGIAVWLEELYIRDDFRGAGLGNEFLTFFKDKYKDTAKRLRLEIEKSNNGAKRLYEKHGYNELTYMQMIIDL